MSFRKRCLVRIVVILLPLALAVCYAALSPAAVVEAAPADPADCWCDSFPFSHRYYYPPPYVADNTIDVGSTAPTIPFILLWCRSQGTDWLISDPPPWLGFSPAGDYISGICSSVDIQIDIDRAFLAQNYSPGEVIDTFVVDFISSKDTFTVIAHVPDEPEMSIIHVSYDSGDDLTGNGTVDYPYRTIQKGINVASDSTDTVLVAAGTYAENINFNGKRITVASKYLTEGLPVYITNTLIETASGTIVTFDTSSEDSNSRLIGFTVQGGVVGISTSDYASPDIRSCILAPNGSNAVDARYGAEPTFRSCTISGNVFAIDEGHPTLRSCTIDGHISISNSFSGGACTAVNCITSNISANGGTIEVDSSTVNGDIEGSSVDYGPSGSTSIRWSTVTGHVRSTKETTTVIKSTVNHLESGSDGEIYAYSTTVMDTSYVLPTGASGGYMQLQSCTMLGKINAPGHLKADSTIVRGTGGIAIQTGTSSTLEVACSDVYDFTGPLWYEGTPGSLNTYNVITQDPQFCDPESGDYHVASSSPCLPANNDCGALIGAFGQGCAAVNVGDNCASPISVKLPADLPYHDVSNTTCGRGNSTTATCLGNYDTGEDIFYRVEVTETTEFSITMNPKGTQWSGIVIDDACPPDPDDCIASATGDDGYMRWLGGLNLSPGTYYIMVDTWPDPMCIPDFDLTIEAVNHPPVLEPIGPKVTTEGVRLTFDVTATDPDGTIPALWADNVPTNATFEDNEDGTGTFDFTPDFTQAGVYDVTFTAADGPLGDFEVVTITVNDAPEISLSPDNLAFTAYRWGGQAYDPPDKNVTIQNSGGGTLNWQALPNRPWISLSDSSGTTAESDEITVHVDGSSMGFGAHSGAVVVSDPAAGNSPETLFVVVMVVSSDVIARDTIRLDASTTWTIDDPSDSSFTIEVFAYSDGLDINEITIPLRLMMSGAEYDDQKHDSFVVVDGVNWNALWIADTYLFRRSLLRNDVGYPSEETDFFGYNGAVLGGQSSQLLFPVPVTTRIGSLILKIREPHKLPASFTIDIDSMFYPFNPPLEYRFLFSPDDKPPFYPEYAGVEISVVNAMIPHISLSDVMLEFTAFQGGSPPPSQSFTIMNGGGGTLNWNVSESIDWLIVDSESGTSNSKLVEATITTTELPPGKYTDTIYVSSSNADNSPQYLKVVYNVGPPAKLCVSPDKWNAPSSGDTSPIITVSNCGNIQTIPYTIGDNAEWLETSETSGTTVGSFTIIATKNPSTAEERIGLVIVDGEIGGSDTVVVTQPPSTLSPRIHLDKTSISFVAIQNGPLPDSQFFTISNDGGGTLNWTVSLPSGDDWLVTDPTEGQDTQDVHVKITSTNLNPETYVSTITVANNDDENDTQTVTVDYVVDSSADLCLSQNEWEAPPAGGSSDPITVRNCGNNQPIAFTIEANAFWIEATPDRGVTETDFIITVQVNSSTTEERTGLVIVDGEIGGSDTVIVTQPPSPLPPRIHLDPTSISFEAVQDGPLPDSQHFTITNEGGGTLEWQVSIPDDVVWMEVDPVSGMSDSQDVYVKIVRTDLPVDILGSSIEVTSTNADNSPDTVDVTYVVLSQTTPPEIDIDPKTFTFQAIEGGENPQDQSLNIYNIGGGTLNWEVEDDAGWLTVDPESGTGDGSVDLKADITGLTANTYSATVTVSDADASNNPVTASVTLDLSGGVILFTADTILDFGTETEVLQLMLNKKGKGTLDWTATPNGSWLSVEPESGSITDEDSPPQSEVTVRVDREDLMAGPYSGSIQIESNGGDASILCDMGVILRSDPLPGSGGFVGILVGDSIRIQFNGLLDEESIGSGLIINSDQSMQTLPVEEIVDDNPVSVLYIFPEAENDFRELLEITVELTPDLLDQHGNSVQSAILSYLTGAVVWPGNTNNDEIVDERDILPIGLRYGSNGPIRDDGSLSWTGEAAHAVSGGSIWSPLNVIYVDADGDGVIDADDICGVVCNWLKTRDLSVDVNSGGNVSEVEKALSQLGLNVLEELYAAALDCPCPDQSPVLELLETLLEKVEEILPREIVLYQNFPNPFNPNTTIEFYLPTSGEIEVSVHNVLGQQVKILFSGYHESGFGTVEWDGTDASGNVVSNGMYFYRLKSGNMALSKSMLLIK
jgi:hypothetical protein